MPMTSFEIGNKLTAVTIGIDAYERHHGGDASPLGGDGLVPIYLSADKVVANSYADPEAMRADLVALEADVAALVAGPRKTFLEGMLKSLRVVVKMLSGASPSFAEKVTDLVGAPAGREDAALIEDARASVDQLLRKAGFVAGTLVQRVQAWETPQAQSDE